MSIAMPITALAPWFGAKRALASRIIAEFGPHNCYWEPMCGCCAVLLAKEPVAAETVCDLHGALTVLARILQCETTCLRLYERCVKTLCNELIWQESVNCCKWLDPKNYDEMANLAYHFIVASWLARNGFGGTDDAHNSFAVRFSANGGTTAVRWRAVVDSIPAWHERLRNVTILNRDCFEVLSRIDDAKGTVIYCDPPYLVEGNRYDHTFTLSQHEQLAKALRRFRRARVLVSYYQDDRLAKWYDGWHCMTMDVPKFLANSVRRDATGDCPKGPEILLINGPRLASQGLDFGD
jgi:DNA adenine methylase